MEKYDFSRIIIKNKKGKKMYLKAGKTTNSCEWTFDKDESIWFETEQQAEKFGNDYFKTFKDWKVENFSYSI